MSVQGKRLTQVRQRIRSLREKELEETVPWRRHLYFLARWASMLHHEFIRDDARIRAESLAFLMSFSLLPILAGLFFIFGIFAQFGMVQDAIGDLVNRFLATIPYEHRDFIQGYVLRFKDAYLASLQQKSGSVGIFALFILGWIGLQTFTNIDRTLNYIWSSDRQRPFLEQVRNFLVVSVAAPIVIIAGLSIPLILKRTALGRAVFESVPLFGVLVNAIITPALILGTFYAMYRYVPVRRVRWRSALAGAAFASCFLLLANKGMEFYFRFFTNTAYGKAAVVPLIGFWIYLVWIIFILGAELSYLVQNGRDVLNSARSWEPGPREGEALLAILWELDRAHRLGKNPVDLERLQGMTGLGSASLHEVLDYLHRKGLVLSVVTQSGDEGCYALARDVENLNLGDLLRDFFSVRGRREGPVSAHWERSLAHWMQYFDDIRLPQLAEKEKGR